MPQDISKVSQTLSISPVTRCSSVLTTTFAPLWAVMIWSGNTVVTKAASVAIEPASIVFYRWLLAFFVLSVFVGKEVWKNRICVARNWHKLMLLSALGMVVYQGLAYQAAKTTSAINMGFIISLAPLISALLASAISMETVGRHTLAGAVVSLIGLSFLISKGHPLLLIAEGIRPGDMLMLVAICANALYGHLLKRWAIPLTTWQQLHVQVACAVLMSLPFYLLNPISPITAANATLILYAGIPASIGAPFFWMKGIKHMGAARTSLFMNLIPVLVTAVACSFLGEQLHVYNAVGGAIVLLGVALGLHPRYAVDTAIK
ncbi:MAG: DMT family transporter [Burkholderiales bacterium]|nr:DMT family transporter [Burkholderiales bacterium]